MDESCIQSNCQANDLGNQLERLTVEDLQAEIANPPSELVQVEAAEAVHHPIEEEDAHCHVKQV